MVRASGDTVSDLKSADVDGMPEKYCSALLTFARNIPDTVVFDLDKATERFQADLREDRYGTKGAFFDAIAQSTRFARREKSATPDRASISMPAVGREVYRLWRDESEPTAGGVKDAIETLSNRITEKTGSRTRMPVTKRKSII